MAVSVVCSPDVAHRSSDADVASTLPSASTTLAIDKLGTNTAAAEHRQAKASESDRQAELQSVPSQSHDRKVTLIYGKGSLVFGWKQDLPGRAFGDQLRDAVRFVTGLQTLEGVELLAADIGSVESQESQQSSIPNDPASESQAFVVRSPAQRATPRDIFEGRVHAVHITVPQGATANSGSSRVQAADTHGAYPRRPASSTALPTRTRNRYAAGPASGAAGPASDAAAAGTAEPARTLPAPVVTPPDKAEGKFQKKGGSQIEFMRMMALNKNPVPKLPEGTQLTAEEVAKHRKPGDAWTIFQGRVYDITSYLDFHPGGKGTIMKGAGKDCTELYNQHHPWVNCDGLIGKLCLGKLVLTLPSTVEEDEEGEDDHGK